MALPIDQVIREQRFISEHPEWKIHRLGDRFNATCDEPNFIVAKTSLRELLDRLEEIVTDGSENG